MVCWGNLKPRALFQIKLAVESFDSGSSLPHDSPHHTKIWPFLGMFPHTSPRCGGGSPSLAMDVNEQLQRDAEFLNERGGHFQKREQVIQFLLNSYLGLEADRGFTILWKTSSYNLLVNC